MNSIEPADFLKNPDVTFRVWEGNEGQVRSKDMRYFKADLVMETNDWQQAKKALNELYEKNKGGLINEKENPNVIHAETTIVGLAGNKSKYLVADYHEKPIVESTKEFKSVNFNTKEYDKRTARENPPIQEKEDRDSVIDPPKPKPVYTKDGYEIPKEIKSSYVIEDGQFKDKASHALRFEDKGEALATPAEDKAVIADMMAVAQAKNWGHLELKGSVAFKQLAWLEASSRDIETTGYIPSDHDIAALSKLKGEKVLNQLLPQSREIDQAEQRKIEAASKVLEKHLAKYPDNLRQEILDKISTSLEKNQLPLPDPVINKEISMKNEGRLLKHGPASYNFDKAEDESYYVTLADQSGKEKVIWGKGLQEAIANAKAKPGDIVKFQVTHQKDVKVNAKVRDENGKVIDQKPIESHRNQWQAEILKPAKDIEKSSKREMETSYER